MNKLKAFPLSLQIPILEILRLDFIDLIYKIRNLRITVPKILLEKKMPKLSFDLIRREDLYKN